MRKIVVITMSLVFTLCGAWLTARSTVQAQQSPVTTTKPSAAPPNAFPVPAPSGQPGFGGDGYQQPGDAFRPSSASGASLAIEDGLSTEVDAAVREYLTSTDDATRKSLREKALESLGKIFDAQQKLRDEELQRIETELSQLREKVKKRASMRQQLIQHRFEGILQEAEGLGWGSNITQPTRSNYRSRNALSPPAVK